MTGFRFLRIRGIPVEAHWSFVLLFLLVVQSVIGLLERPEIDTQTIMAMAFAGATLFFLSLLLHEFGHALWARRERWNVEKITLYGLGGIAWVAPSGPYWSGRAYFRVIAAGPLVTVVLVIVFGASHQAAEALDWPRSVVDVLGLLAWLNLGLLLFNLIPALPLDGGQLLRAWLYRSHDFESARRTLMRTGAVCAYVALGGGTVLLATGRLYAGYLLAVAGIMILLLGSSYYRAATSVRARPRRIRVAGDLIRERGATAPEGTSANGVVGQAGRPSIQIDPNTSLERALEQLPNVTDRGIVVEDGRVIGVLSRQAVAEALLAAADARRGRADLPAAPR